MDSAANCQKLGVTTKMSSLELPRIIHSLKNGGESLHSNGQNLGVTVLDFWRWSVSDLVSNTTRGILAEFIIAHALDIPFDQIRDEWGAYDLRIPDDDIKIQVKSAAYVQSWYQSKPSKISFLVRKTLAWNPDTNRQELEARRHAEVYVFALLAHNDQTTIDPLNVDQWKFFVLPTTTLEARTRSQHSITLRTLERLSVAVTYQDLKKKIQEAASQNRIAVLESSPLV